MGKKLIFFTLLSPSTIMSNLIINNAGFYQSFDNNQAPPSFMNLPTIPYNEMKTSNDFVFQGQFAMNSEYFVKMTDISEVYQNRQSMIDIPPQNTFNVNSNEMKDVDNAEAIFCSNLPEPNVLDTYQQTAQRIVAFVDSLCCLANKIPLSRMKRMMLANGLFDIMIVDGLNILSTEFRTKNNGCQWNCQGKECTLEAMVAWLSECYPNTLLVIAIKELNFRTVDEAWKASVRRMSYYDNVIMCPATMPDSMKMEAPSGATRLEKVMISESLRLLQKDPITKLDHDDALVRLLLRLFVRMLSGVFPVSLLTNDKYKDKRYVNYNFEMIHYCESWLNTDIIGEKANGEYPCRCGDVQCSFSF